MSDFRFSFMISDICQSPYSKKTHIFHIKSRAHLRISFFCCNFVADFESRAAQALRGVSTSVVHQLPKLRRRVRFPYTALGGRWPAIRLKESKSVCRYRGKEKHLCFNLIGRGKSGQRRAPQRLTAVRQSEADEYMHLHGHIWPRMFGHCYRDE